MYFIFVNLSKKNGWNYETYLDTSNKTVRRLDRLFSNLNLGRGRTAMIPKDDRGAQASDVLNDVVLITDWSSLHSIRNFSLSKCCKKLMYFFMCFFSSFCFPFFSFDKLHLDESNRWEKLITVRHNVCGPVDKSVGCDIQYLATTDGTNTCWVTKGELILKYSKRKKRHGTWN